MVTLFRTAWELVKKHRINIVVGFLALTGPAMAFPDEDAQSKTTLALLEALSGAYVEIHELQENVTTLEDELRELGYENKALRWTVEDLEFEILRLRTSCGLPQ